MVSIIDILVNYIEIQEICFLMDYNLCPKETKINENYK